LELTPDCSDPPQDANNAPTTIANPIIFMLVRFFL
jgi:hypothetical protein